MTAVQKLLISESILNNELSQALAGSIDIQEIIITGDTDKLTGFPGIKLTDFEDIISDNNDSDSFTQNYSK